MAKIWESCNAFLCLMQIDNHVIRQDVYENLQNEKQLDDDAVSIWFSDFFLLVKLSFRSSPLKTTFSDASVDAFLRAVL